MSAQVLPLPLPLPAFQAVPLAEQLPQGRLTEIARLPSGAQLTLAASCVVAAQVRGEPVAWLQQEGGSLFPPDLAESGVDLDALLVVHVPAKAGRAGLCKAAELLLRSGSFGLVVIDLVGRVGQGAGVAGVAGEIQLQAQSRLFGLAREHDSAVLLLSDAPQQHARQYVQQASLGPLVGLCIEPHRQRVSRGVFRIEPRARKDKSGSLCALASEPRRGPWGLL